MRRPYLPADKQFLVTRNIPCLCRAKDLLQGKMEEEMVEGGTEEGDAWVATGGSTATGEIEKIEDMSLADEPKTEAEPKEEGGDPAAAQAQDAEESDSDDVPDMEDFVVEEEDDEVVTIHPRGAEGAAGAAGTQEDSKILKTRTYDISVTYDKYYQTPRFWLIGYDESRQLLKPELALGKSYRPSTTNTARDSRASIPRPTARRDSRC